MLKFDGYLKNVETALKARNATEHTHRPFLKSLVESLQVGITATNEPKRIACGAPDYIITRGEIAQGEIPLGYIEAKDVGENLDKAETSEQLKRYKESLSNLILTDYLEFRWFVGSEKRLTVKLAELDKAGRVTPTANGEQELTELFSNFLTIQIPTVATSKELAGRMASIARLIRVTIEKALVEETRDKNEPDLLHEQMQSFQKVLLPELTETQFADLYAQTIAYGLFSARCNTKLPPFTRQSAAYNLPKTNPFLRQLFDNIAGINLDERITWAVDDLAELLNRSDMSAILADFGKRTRQEDPVVHFYETFLAAYDPKLRETRGVYYTPEPVVSYIVRSVDQILQRDFGLPKGLADSSKIKIKSADGKSETESHKLLILDPATGTGTFLYSVIKQIARRFEKNKGMWDSYVSEHLLPRIFGFELLVAPYSVAHLKLGLLLEETGYKFQSNERLRVFLTNTLEEIDRLANVGGLTRWLNDEADSASKIKQDAPVMVILGNPPYSGHSANTGNWIKQLLHGVDTHTGNVTENYFEVDGKPLGEKNPKWLNNDYVKFIRFAQWRIEQTGYGILGFITSNSYLDSPTFRGMRESLMKTFDEIYILDLHGNSNKKERSPDGSKDENVFDITEGVSIGIFVKKQSFVVSTPTSGIESAKVFHKHLYGLREIFTQNANDERELFGGKYQWLWQHDISTTNWTELKSTSPNYLFFPQGAELREEYEHDWKITDVMPVNVLGFQTHRDHFAVDFDKDNLQKRINDLRERKLSNEEIQNLYNVKDNRDWKLSKARKELRADEDWRNNLISFSYNLFDNRFSYFSKVAMDYPRRELLDHVAGKENICLNIVRQTKMSSWQHAVASKSPSPAVYVEMKDGSNVFPLYLYPIEKKGLFDENVNEAPKPNFSDEFIKDFSDKLKLEFVAENPPATANGTDKTNRVQSSNFSLSSAQAEHAEARTQNDKTFTPEDVFYYAYAVFHSPTYRSRYAEFLKIDFPRLPLTSNVELFRSLVRFGAELVGLHLLEANIESNVTFPEKGDNVVEFVKFEVDPNSNESDSRIQNPESKIGKVWINKTQYFENVPETVWNFHIGGYQVLHKWLKDRKGRTLSFDDLEHYAKVVSALSQTIEIMSQIDETIEDNTGFPIEYFVP